MKELLDGGFVDEQVSELVLKYCRRWNLTEFEGLMATRIFEEEGLVEIFSKRFQLPVVEEHIVENISFEVAEAVPYAQARKMNCFPIESEKSIQTLWVANPCESGLEKICPGTPRALGTRRDIIQAICEYYPIEKQYLENGV